MEPTSQSPVNLLISNIFQEFNRSQVPLDSHRHVLTSLRRIMHAVDQHSRCLMKQHQITLPQLICLQELEENGTQTLAVLARNLHMSASTMVGVIDRLEEKQCVFRTRSKADRRAVFVAITETGRLLLHREPHLLHHALYGRLQMLSLDERATLAHSLDLLAHMLEEKD